MSAIKLSMSTPAFNLHCRIAHQQNVILEPVGTSRPKFDSKLESSSITERKDSSMALTCLAQSNPSPMFRLVACFLFRVTIYFYFIMKYP